MAVDRGELRYGISVRSGQTFQTLRRFRDELKKSREAFADFKGELAAGAGETSQLREELEGVQRATRGVREETRRQSRETARTSGAERQAARQRSEETRRRLRNFRRLARARRAQVRETTRTSAAERKAATERSAEVRARLRNFKRIGRAQRAQARDANRQQSEGRRLAAEQARAARDQATQERAAAQGRAEEIRRLQEVERQAARERAAEVRRRLRSFRRLGRAQRAQARTVSEQQAVERRLATTQARAAAAKARADAKGIRDAQRLNRELRETNSTASRAVFTFRRLFGVLAAFTIAREVASAFSGLISGGVRFGEQIDQSTIGIGGLIAAVADARDEFGQLVDPVEALPAAFLVAEGSVKRLRKESLLTVATFDELLKTFQVAVAPGFNAGLQLEQIEQLSIRVTQAAQALGVPLNQLSEEIRALLTGNITGRTTRIATALGITPDTIRNAREAGNLAEVLEERFATFGATAENVSRTLTGTFARLRGVFQELTAQASAGLRVELTDALQTLIDQFLVLDEVTGDISINPDALAATTEVFDAVAEVITQIKVGLTDLPFSEIGDKARSFGVVAREALVAFFELLPGIVRGLTDFASVAAVVLRVLTQFGPVLSIVLRLQLSFLAIRGLLSPIVGLITAIPIQVLRWRAAQQVTAAAAAATATSTGAAAVATSAAATSAATAAANMNLAAGAAARVASFTNLLAAGLGIALVAANPLLESLLGMELTIGQSTDLVARGFINEIKNATLEAKKLGIVLSEALGIESGESFLGRVGESLGRFAAAVNAGVLDLVGADKLAAEIDAALAAAIVNDRALAESRGELRDIDKELAELSAEQLANNEDVEATLRRIDELAQRRKDQEAEIERITARIAENQADIASGGITFTPPDEEVTQEEQDRLEALRLSTAQLRIQGIQKSNIATLTATETDQARLAILLQREKISGLRREGNFARQKIQAAIDELDASRESSRGEERKRFFTEQINLLKAQQRVLEAQTNAELLLAERKLGQIVLANEALVRAEERKVEQIRAGNSELAISTRLLQRQASDFGAIGSAQRRQLADLDAQVSRQQVQANLQRGATLLAIEELQAKEDQTLAVQAQVVALQQKLALEDQNAAASLAELERQREIARIRAEGGVLEGAGLGVEAFRESLGTVATELEGLVSGVLGTLTQGLGSQLVGAIVGAFDENGDFIGEKFGENLKQLAGSILQQIASQLLQTTINLLLQRFLLDSANETKKQAQEAAFLATQQVQEATFKTTQRSLDLANAQTIAFLQIQTAQTIAAIRAASGGGAAKGGFIGSGRYSAFAVGGHVHGGLPHTTPPPGVPRSDTVSAYLTPGEFVTRTSAVRTYGLQVMDALNRRLIDPTLMKGMLGLRKHSNIVRHASKGPGFQTGGLVSDNLAAAAVSSAASGAAQEVGSSGGGAVGVPVDTDTFETMLASGKEGFRRFLRDNASDFDGILRQGRTGG